jgi:hypothetical protein
VKKTPDKIFEFARMVEDLMSQITVVYGFLNIQVRRAQKGQPGRNEAEDLRMTCIELILDGQSKLEKWTEQVRSLDLGPEADSAMALVSKLTSSVIQELQEFRLKLDNEVTRMKEACDRDSRYDCELEHLGKAFADNGAGIWSQVNKLLSWS